MYTLLRKNLKSAMIASLAAGADGFITRQYPAFVKDPDNRYFNGLLGNVVYTIYKAWKNDEEIKEWAPGLVCGLFLEHIASDAHMGMYGMNPKAAIISASFMAAFTFFTVDKVVELLEHISNVPQPRSTHQHQM